MQTRRWTASVPTAFLHRRSETSLWTMFPAGSPQLPRCLSLADAEHQLRPTWWSELKERTADHHCSMRCQALRLGESAHLTPGDRPQAAPQSENRRWRALVLAFPANSVRRIPRLDTVQCGASPERIARP
jgi:hypothetical protein